jgi:hypothetical protein
MTDEFLNASLEVLEQVYHEKRFEPFVPRGLALLEAKKIIFKFPETLLTPPEREKITQAVKEMALRQRVPLISLIIK